MIVKPKIRGFICTTSHPMGCFANVKSQIDYVKSQPKLNGAKKVLVIGASMGYGLASRITAAYANDAATIGVIFDKQGDEKRTGTAGWYNTAAFEKLAHADGIYAKTINGDAFSEDIKKQTIDLIKKDLGKVDMVVYSLAAPRRTDTDGIVYNSVLKTIGEEYTNKTIDITKKSISEITISPANDEEILHTVKVMGGEDWKLWIDALKSADAIEDDAITVAYSYIGPSITHPMYTNGTIGRAKEHLASTAKAISSGGNIKAYVSVNKALVTQSSSAIPIVPLYISILFKVMKEMGNHEGCIEQMYRLFGDKILIPEVDSEGLIRLDDLEMQTDVQKRVLEIWDNINDDNLSDSADIDGYLHDFHELFGFGIESVDYDADVPVNECIESIFTAK